MTRHRGALHLRPLDSLPSPEARAVIAIQACEVVFIGLQSATTAVEQGRETGPAVCSRHPPFDTTVPSCCPSPFPCISLAPRVSGNQVDAACGAGGGGMWGVGGELDDGSGRGVVGGVVGVQEQVTFGDIQGFVNGMLVQRVQGAGGIALDFDVATVWQELADGLFKRHGGRYCDAGHGSFGCVCGVRCGRGLWRTDHERAGR